MRVSISLALVLALLCSPLPAAAPPPPNDRPAPAPGDKSLQIAIAAQDSSVLYSAQLLGDLDRPIGAAMTLKGLTIPARIDAKGQLELDLRADGKFRAIPRQEIVSVTLKGDDKGKTQSLKLQVNKREDGTWVYRNLTQLAVRIENEPFAIVDANGNGIYNEAGVDGMAWQGETCLFPLPAAAERWCSAAQEFTGLQLGPWGENPRAEGRALSTTVAAALGVLKGVNEERVKLGLTPRPEDAKLSADLQKHCAYMVQVNTLTHNEDKSKSGYSEEGNAAGMRSILNMGSAPAQVAAGMIRTYFHRQDVIRPNTIAFGVGSDGRYNGIDGRTRCDKAPEHFWPVLCPIPGQKNLPTTYGKEAPDATPGDDSAGYPISVYFGTNKLKLVEHSLKVIGPAESTAQPSPAKPAAPSGETVECYVFDPQTGASASFTAFQHCVCVIPKDPLKAGMEYEVMLKVDVAGKPWTKTWRFSTGTASPAQGKRR